LILRVRRREYRCCGKRAEQEESKVISAGHIW
jgi:hypothetical protein